MKTLFIILKATTGITLVTPTVLSVTQDFHNQNFGDSQPMMDKTVNTSTSDPKGSVLNSVLENNIDPNQNFSNFIKNKMQVLMKSLCKVPELF